jgi:CBS domain-containing protein
VNDPTLTPFVVRPHDTLEEALTVIEANRHRTVVVVDERGIVVGTLSDGDARKAILDHRLLTIPVEHVMNTNFVALEPENRGEATALLEEEHIFIIPLVDEGGRLVGLAKAYE